jgi:hypothetical protein
MQYGGIWADGDVVHLVTAATHMGGENAHLDYRRSSDGGTTWSSPVRITAAGEQVRRANVQEEEGTIYVFGGRVDAGQNYEGALVFRSTDQGRTWSSTLVDADAGAGWGLAEGQTVHLAQDKFVGADRKGFYWRSTDAGDTWSAPIGLGNPAAGYGEARHRVALSGDALLIAWTSGGTGSGIRGVRSLDGGLSWSEPVVLMPESGSMDFGHQELKALGSGRFVMTAADEASDYDIWHAWSADGRTWSEPAFGFNVPGESSQLSGFDAGDGWAHGHTIDGKYARVSLEDILTDGTWP